MTETTLKSLEIDIQGMFYIELLAAQREIESVDKDGKNPFFKSEYTTLNATILACKEVLNRHNIVVLQPVTSDENGVYVSTTLIHISGGSITSRMRIVPAKASDPQAQGSAITYARRYSLKSMLCMSDADDDGEKAMARTKPEARPEADNLTATCKVHNEPMVQKWSEKKQKMYWYHKNEDGQMCFGKGYMEMR